MTVGGRTRDQKKKRKMTAIVVTREKTEVRSQKAQVGRKKKKGDSEKRGVPWAFFKKSGDEKAAALDRGKLRLFLEKKPEKEVHGLLKKFSGKGC